MSLYSLILLFHGALLGLGTHFYPVQDETGIQKDTVLFTCNTSKQKKMYCYVEHISMKKTR